MPSEFLMSCGRTILLSSVHAIDAPIPVSLTMPSALLGALKHLPPKTKITTFEKILHTLDDDTFPGAKVLICSVNWVCNCTY